MSAVTKLTFKHVSIDKKHPLLFSYITLTL